MRTNHVMFNISWIHTCKTEFIYFWPIVNVTGSNSKFYIIALICQICVKSSTCSLRLHLHEQRNTNGNACSYSIVSFSITFISCLYLIKVFHTLVIDMLFACKVARAAQQTRALELDSPELGGIVPSINNFIPRGFSILRCSTMPRNPHKM